MASDATYFDPTTDKRVDGADALRARFAPMRGATLPFRDPRYEIIDPKVQPHGEVVLLTFNLVNYAKVGDRPESIVARWNSSELYAREAGRWRLIHSHWSFVKPEIKQPTL